MLKQKYSSRANRVVQSPRYGTGKTAFSARIHESRARRPYGERAVSGSLQGYCEPSVAREDPPCTNPWLTVLTFFMEGIAIYGASLHPTAAMPVDMIRGASAPDVTRPQRMTVDGPYGAQQRERVDAIEFERPAWTSEYSVRRWTWLGSLAGTISTLWAHWQRERQIKRAVAAMSQYDDRTLRGLGIRGRSEIEQMVRYCHDC